MLVLVLGIVWGKGASVFSNRRMYKARFETVLGLEGGDPVMIRGTRQGQVKKINLTARDVEVDFWIYENTPVYSDALGAVESEELMGGKQLSIEPGTSGIPVQDGHVFSGTMRGDAGRILGSLERVIDRTDSLLAGVQEITGDPAGGGMQ